MNVNYLHLPAGREPPSLGDRKPFKAIVVLEQAVGDDWQNSVSDWLVGSGCLYVLAWGQECSSWDDSVDYASIAASGDGDIPDDRFVMTTWHEDESLSETFWFAGHCALHPTVPLAETMIIHIGPKDQRSEMLRAYAAAQQETEAPSP